MTVSRSITFTRSIAVVRPRAAAQPQPSYTRRATEQGSNSKRGGVEDLLWSATSEPSTPTQPSSRAEPLRGAAEEPAFRSATSERSDTQPSSRAEPLRGGVEGPAFGSPPPSRLPHSRHPERSRFAAQPRDLLFGSPPPSRHTQPSSRAEPPCGAAEGPAFRSATTPAGTQAIYNDVNVLPRPSEC
jgi:hypothetical protein